MNKFYRIAVKGREFPEYQAYEVFEGQEGRCGISLTGWSANREDVAAQAEAKGHSFLAFV